MICFFEKRAARREIFAAGDLSFFRFIPFFGGRLVVFVKFGDFYSTSFGDFYSTSTVSQVKTLNKIVFLTFSFITFSTAFL